MTVFESVPFNNINKLAEWLDKYTGDDCAWINWFDRKYCKQCDGVSIDGDSYGDYGWCEIHGKCKYFPEMDEAPNCVQIIKIWLESEDNDGVQN